MTVREGLPRVSYATALDTYLNVCIVYEMAAMIEHAAVNYFTKVLPLEGGADSDEEAEAGPQAGKPPDTEAQGVLHQTEVHVCMCIETLLNGFIGIVQTNCFHS